MEIACSSRDAHWSAKQDKLMKDLDKRKVDRGDARLADAQVKGENTAVIAKLQENESIELERSLNRLTVEEKTLQSHVKAHKCIKASEVGSRKFTQAMF